jgi:hypothetical protein
VLFRGPVWQLRPETVDDTWAVITSSPLRREEVGVLIEEAGHLKEWRGCGTIVRSNKEALNFYLRSATSLAVPPSSHLS